MGGVGGEREKDENNVTIVLLDEIIKKIKKSKQKRKRDNS